MRPFPTDLVLTLTIAFSFFDLPIFRLWLMGAFGSTWLSDGRMEEIYKRSCIFPVYVHGKWDVVSQLNYNYLLLFHLDLLFMPIMFPTFVYLKRQNLFGCCTNHTYPFNMAVRLYSKLSFGSCYSFGFTDSLAFSNHNFALSCVLKNLASSPWR